MEKEEKYFELIRKGKKFIRFTIPITASILFWFLIYWTAFNVTFQQLLFGFFDFAVQAGLLVVVYYFTKLIVEKIIDIKENYKK